MLTYTARAPGYWKAAAGSADFNRHWHCCLQMRVTVGNLRRARSYTPADGAGRVAAVVEGSRPNRVQLQLAGRSKPISGTRPPLKFGPPLQLVQQGGAAALCPPAKRPRNSSNDSMCSSDDEGQGGSGAGGGTAKPVKKKQAVSVGSLAGATTLELSFDGPSLDVAATQASCCGIAECVF